MPFRIKIVRIETRLSGWGGFRINVRLWIGHSKDRGIFGTDLEPVVVKPEANHFNSMVLEFGSLLCITLGSLWKIMFRAIHVDRKALRFEQKVRTSCTGLDEILSVAR